MTEAWMDVPHGRKLEGAAGPGKWTLGVLRTASPEYVELCRRQWPEARADDFAWGRKVVDRATGVEYRIVTSDPFANGAPRDSAVVAFCIRDGFVVLLRRRGEASAKVTEIGVVSGSRATGRERHDLAGTRIW